MSFSWEELHKGEWEYEFHSGVAITPLIPKKSLLSCCRGGRENRAQPQSRNPESPSPQLEFLLQFVSGKQEGDVSNDAEGVLQKKGP